MSSPQQLLLLDGGIGHLLKSKGVDQLVPGLKYDQLFLAGALANDLAPEAVAAVHREYIAAGRCCSWRMLAATCCCLCMPAMLPAVPPTSGLLCE